MDALFSLSSPSTCPHFYLPSLNQSSSSTLPLAAASFPGHVVLEHYNHTGRLNRRPASSSSRQAGVSTTAAVSLLISVFIILENLSVLVAILDRMRYRRRWLYVCLANITLSDLLAGVAYVLNVCMSGDQTFRLSPALWLFREGVLFVALAASIFSLLLMAMERYTTMIHAQQVRRSARTSCRIYGLVALCWVLALALGFLPLLGWNCICSLDSCSTLLPLYSKSYILFSLVLFLLILLAIGVLYGAIYCHVGSSGSSAEQGLSSQRSRKRHAALLKTVVSIVGVFVICWGPLFLLLLVDFFCTSRRCAPLYQADWFIALAVLNSALNPVIYSLGSPELRKAIITRLCCCCRKAGFISSETNSTSGSRNNSRNNSRNSNSFSKVRNLSVVAVSPPPLLKGALSPSKKRSRLSSTTTCLSMSSG